MFERDEECLESSVHAVLRLARKRISIILKYSASVINFSLSAVKMLFQAI